MTPTTRVMVFIDYQNMYQTARNEFGTLAGVGGGAFFPHRLADLLVERTNAPARELVGVRVYRGLADAGRDPQTHQRGLDQAAEWEFHNGVQVFHHRLRYANDGSPPVEKGVDVALAVDLYRGTVKEWYDVAIVCSRDTDLVPAVRAALDDFGHRIRIELAAWGSGGAAPYRIEGRLWCHWLDAADQRRVADRNYYGPHAATG